MALGLTWGCGKAAKTDDDDKLVKAKPPEESKRLYTSAGNATVRDPEGARPIRYVINWKESQLDYTLEHGASGGALKRVTGELYRTTKDHPNGQLASRFTADRARADRSKNLLVLEGNVVVNGIDPAARLECQRVEWTTNKRLLKASGKVTIRLEEGTVGPIDELWCLPDLKRAGTPGSLPQ